MCCSGFLKTMMFIFNGAIFLAGAAVLGVGVWLKVDSGSLMGLLDSVDAPAELEHLATASYLLIGVGAVLLFIGFLGCCGAVKESRCMLMTFFSIVLIIFLVEVAGAVLLFVFQDYAGEVFTGLEDDVKETIKNKYGGEGNEALTILWDSTMDGLDCCGYKDYTDFNYSAFNNASSLYPDQCCNKTISNPVKCTASKATLSNIEGCSIKIRDLIEENAMIIAAVALGIAAIEIAAMVVSMVLYNRIGNKA